MMDQKQVEDLLEQLQANVAAAGNCDMRSRIEGAIKALHFVLGKPPGNAYIIRAIERDNL